jgi:Mg2+ and Co2+ transporter CorA
MKLILGVFKSEYEIITVFRVREDGSCYGDILPNYVRVSENVEVEFPELDQAEILRNQLEALTRQEKEVLKEFQDKLDTIEEKRASLLALPNFS